MPADTHDTPFSWPLPLNNGVAPPLGLGVVWIAQLVPSHRSANVSVVATRIAFDVVADGGARARRHARHPEQMVWRERAGLGVARIAQPLPFHRSVNVTLPALVGVLADRGARARRHARHPKQAGCLLPG